MKKKLTEQNMARISGDQDEVSTTNTVGAEKCFNCGDGVLYFPATEEHKLYQPKHPYKSDDLGDI